MSVTKRSVAKLVANVLVQTASGFLITKTLSTTVPTTNNYKVAEMTGAVGGFVIGEQTLPLTDKFIDNLFDKRRKVANITTLNK